MMVTNNLKQWMSWSRCKQQNKNCQQIMLNIKHVIFKPSRNSWRHDIILLSLISHKFLHSFFKKFLWKQQYYLFNGFELKFIKNIQKKFFWEYYPHKLLHETKMYSSWVTCITFSWIKKSHEEWRKKIRIVVIKWDICWCVSKFKL